MINILSLVLTLIGCLFGSVGTVLIKKGINHFSLKKFWTLFTNKLLLSGVFLFFISIIFYLIALQWEELSTLFPVVSFSYVLISLLSVKFLGEKMNLKRWIGLICIVLGILLISWGS